MYYIAGRGQYVYSPWVYGHRECDQICPDPAGLVLIRFSDPTHKADKRRIQEECCTKVEKDFIQAIGEFDIPTQVPKFSKFIN